MAAVTPPEGGAHSGRGDHGLAGSELSNTTTLQPPTAWAPHCGGMTAGIECFTMCVLVRFNSPQRPAAC